MRDARWHAGNVTVDEETCTGDGTRVFAGRSDPFIFDLAAWHKMISTRQVAFADAGVNTTDGRNVLSVVVDIAWAATLGPGPLFAVVGETLVGGKLPVRLERVGRPEIKNITMGMKDFDTVNRDLDVQTSTTPKTPSTLAMATWAPTAPG